MNWDAISAIGEIVGATAVVLSLIYLAVQIRHGTRATEAASVQEAVALDLEFLLTVGSDPVTAQLWATYLAAPDELPEDQRLQGAFLMASVARRLEANYLQNQLGTLSDQGWRSRQRFFSGVARSKGFNSFVNSERAAFLTKEFIDYMVELAASERKNK